MRPRARARSKHPLIEAGGRDRRFHDARRTAATFLPIRGVPERVVRQSRCWSSTAVAARYPHVTGGILKDAAKRVGGLTWEVAQGTDERRPREPETSR